MSSRQQAGPRIPPDTDTDSYAAQVEAYRRMSGAQRTAVTFRLNLWARETARAGIRARHPDYDDEKLRLALFRLVMGDEVTRAVWPDEELVDP